MNEDPKYWEEKILPWIQKLKALQEKARLTLLELEAVAYSKAGYVKVHGRYIKKAEKITVKQWADMERGWKEKPKTFQDVYDRIGPYSK